MHFGCIVRFWPLLSVRVDRADKCRSGAARQLSLFSAAHGALDRYSEIIALGRPMMWKSEFLINGLIYNETNHLF